jgi:hypothetical protein
MPGDRPRVNYVRYTNEQDWLGLAGRAASGDSCFVLVFFSPQDERFHQLQSSYQQALHTVAAEGTISFYCPHSRRPGNQAIEVVAAVGQLVTDKCSGVAAQ